MRKILLLLVSICVMAGLSACGKQEPAGENVCQIYAVSNTETKVEAHPHEMVAVDEEGRLQELVECLSTQPEKLEYKAPLAMGFQVLSLTREDNRIAIDVDTAYLSMPATTEVLVRAAIVRTLTQLQEVKYVVITVNGDPLFDNAGELVGAMTAEQFINNDGNEINTYELAKVKLYFANEAGDKLIPAYREKYYSTNIPMERLLVEELIAGPSGKVPGLYPSVNSEVKVISVMTKDGICYVNLDNNFLTVVNNVPTEMSVYSIVNTLAELSNVNKVQILVNGEVPASFSNTTYERNLDFVTTLEALAAEKEEREREEQEQGEE